MKSIELEVIPNWRYCAVRSGEKIPYPAGWQNNPRHIRDIESTNVGLLLGTASGGLVALDFDGASAWTWFSQRIGCDIPKTVMWTSGKDSRCQMAFTVPEPYWNYIRTHKITHTRDAVIADGEGFEFRWTGCQSVMPPSTLADGRTYQWITDPCQTNVAEIPNDILVYWLQLGEPPTVLNTNPVLDIKIDDINEQQFNDVSELLEKLHQRHPRPDYDTWMRIAFATASELGNSVAAVLLSSIWPEQERGEYIRLLSGRDPSRSPTVKSLSYMLGESNRRQHSQEYLNYLAKMHEIKQLERLLKEKRNEQSKH